MLLVILRSRPDYRHAWWSDRQIAFGWINYRVNRIRVKCTLVHGMEV